MVDTSACSPTSWRVWRPSRARARSRNSPTKEPSSSSPVSDEPAVDPSLTAQGVREALEAQASDDQRAKILARMTDDATQVIGVRMGTVFDIAKANTRMPLPEVE